MPRTRLVHLLVALCASPTLAVGAQAAVSGQVTILEKPGDATKDADNTVVYLDPETPSRAHTSITNTSMSLQSRQFAPRVRVVTAGSRVDFPNQDPFSHNVFSKAFGGFDTEVFRHGQTRSNTFHDTGAWPLYCNIHPKMTGFVVVVNTPWFAQAGSDGRFTIDKVPPGKYLLHVWHDRAPEQKAEIVVPGTGLSGLAYQLDARGYQYVPHKNKFGQDYRSGLGDSY